MGGSRVAEASPEGNPHPVSHRRVTAEGPASEDRRPDARIRFDQTFSNLGGRFSRKAVMASLGSPVA